MSRPSVMPVMSFRYERTWAQVNRMQLFDAFEFDDHAVLDEVVDAECGLRAECLGK